ncbi:hypothetical protein EMIT0P100_120187 [Pseudomonas sp. IT-P100]
MHNYAKIHNLSESMSGQRKSRCAGRWEKLGVTVSQYPRPLGSSLLSLLGDALVKWQHVRLLCHFALVTQDWITMHLHPQRSVQEATVKPALPPTQ